MTRALYRRLDRLTDQIAVGRMIVVRIAHDRVEDHELIDGTLVAAEIERTDADLTVLVTHYGRLGDQPPCALLSVWPLSRKRRQ